MAPKSVLEKEAWKWAETTMPKDITEEHIRRAYRLGVESCNPGDCRRNCVGSPFCLNCLGEKWIVKQKEENEKKRKNRLKKKSSHADEENGNNENQIDKCFDDTDLQNDDGDQYDVSDSSDDDSDDDDDYDYNTSDDNTDEEDGSDNDATDNSDDSSYSTDSSEDDSSDDEETYCRRLSIKLRKKNEIIGLKNLGATCYINTLLQIWFHYPAFRRAVLLWRDEEDDEEEEKSGVDADGTSIELYESDSEGGRITENDEICYSNEVDVARDICQELQLVFAELKFCNRRFVDPTAFINCLKLDDMVQQDAQEFSKLLLSRLEAIKPPLRHHSGKNLFEELFNGKYEYITKCGTCQVESHNPASFHELPLNIKGHDILEDSIKEFLQEEHLREDNQYMCWSCKAKRDATRHIQLVTLPPVLNFQLMRFMYNTKTNSKEKLKSFIQYPLELDMSKYMLSESDGTNGLVYDLYSVLLHSGNSANHGHYFTLVRDLKVDKVYVLNDLRAVEIHKDKLNIEVIESDNKSVGKKLTVRDGYLRSRKACMLVYMQRQHHQQPVPEVGLDELHQSIEQTITKGNELHQVHVADVREKTKVFNRLVNELCEAIQNVYEAASNHNDDIETFEWISSDWFRKFANGTIMDTTDDEVDNYPLLCKHDKMNPNIIERAKLLPPQAVEIISKRYGINVRLNCKESMCRKCVMSHCQAMNSLNLLHEDFKKFQALCKGAPKNEDDEGDAWYWIGKNSCRTWKMLAEKWLLFSNKEEEDMFETFRPLTDDETVGRLEHCTATGVTDMQDDGRMVARKKQPGFNEDILCQHKALSVNESRRKLISPEAWSIVKKYFPDAMEMNSKQPVCSSCFVDAEIAMEKMKMEETSAREQKKGLNDLYLRRNRPVLSEDNNQPLKLNVVTEAFVGSWISYVKKPKLNPRPTDVGNKSCICRHGGLIYDITSNDGLSGKVQFLTQAEWNTVTKYFEPDFEIFVERHCNDGVVSYTSTPELCKECSDERFISETLVEFQYNDVTVYVRKYSDVDSFLQEIYPATSDASENTGDVSSPDLSSSSPIDEAKVESNFNSGAPGVKRKLDDTEIAVDKAKQRRIDDKHSKSQPTRRSTRKLETTSFTISSDQTIRSFKDQLCRAYKERKEYMRIHYDGKDLTDESLTFAQYLIPRGALIHLLIDPSNMDRSQVSLEHGFKGSVLMDQ